MNQIERSIQYADRLFTEFPWRADTLAELKKQRNDIAEKHADTTLKLAVIGDFSSGKSTLINALCGYDCLKTGIMATTAIPTYIQGGPYETAELHIELNDGRRYRLNDAQEAQSFCQVCNITLGSDFKENLNIVTTRESVAHRTARVDVLLPDSGALGSLCIIDTPGVNPGQENSELHVTRTKQVLEHAADSVIILFPATQAYTYSFELFLKENAERFMNHAVFVLTMMDRVEEDERQELEQYVRENIREKLGIRDPLLVSCSAYLAGKDEAWARRFNALREALFTHLREQREFILSCRMAQLLRQMLGVMKDGVAQQTQALQSSLKVMEENAPPQLAKKLDDIKVQESNRLWEMRSVYKENERVTRREMEGYMLQAVEYRVSAFSSHADFKVYASRTDGLAGDIANQTPAYYRYSQQVADSAQGLVSWTGDHMQRELETCYGRIGNTALLQNAASTAMTQPLQEKIGSSLAQVRESYAKVETQNTVLTSGGAAAIGLILGGPIGAVVGGIVGYLGKDKLFMKKARADFVQQVRLQLPTISDRISGECIPMTLQCIDKSITRLEEMARHYMSLYSRLYNDALQVYEEKKMRLNREIADNGRYSKEIEEQIQNLKLVSVRREFAC
jgi:GTPase SAR1 family protein